MKQWIILILASLLLIIGGFYEINFLDGSSKILLSKINYSKEILKSLDTDRAYGYFTELENEWQCQKRGWSFFVDNNEISDVEKELLKYKISLESGEKSDAYSSICELERMVSSVVEKQKVNIETVF